MDLHGCGVTRSGNQPLKDRCLVSLGIPPRSTRSKIKNFDTPYAVHSIGLK